MKPGVLRPLHFDTTPSLETIRNPYRVRLIQLWLTESVASLGPLMMIYPYMRIVLATFLLDHPSVEQALFVVLLAVAVVGLMESEKANTTS